MMDDQEMPDDKTLGGAGKRDLVFTRVFDAPVDRVWKAWTDPEQVKRWWGPDGFSCPFARINFREGGISLVCMRAPKEFMGGQDMYSTWTYTKIVLLRELEYLHHFSDKAGNRVAGHFTGSSAGNAGRGAKSRHLQSRGRRQDGSKRNRIRLAGGPHDGDVQMGMEQCLDKMAAIFGKA